MSNTPILIQGTNNLYDPLFCNLISNNQKNGYYTCDDCNFNYSNNSDGSPVATILNTNSYGISDCQTKCTSDQTCKAYTYNNSNCKTYANIPLSINTNVPGSSSGYLLNMHYDLMFQ